MGAQARSCSISNEMSTTPTSADILKRASAVGTYYGFSPLSSLALSKRGTGSKAPFPDALALDALDPTAREVAGFLKTIRDNAITPSRENPLFVWHTNIAPGRAAPKTVVIQFHILGVDHAIADAVLIRATRSLVQDLSKKDPILHLNSMGDKETRGRFLRELTTYFKKHGASLPEECTLHAKQNVFEAAEMLLAQPDPFHLPCSTDHLSEASRKHFERVLEYLESTETPYELAPTIMSKGNAWTETCFELRSDSDISAWGSRYNELTKHFFKSPVSSIGAVIRIDLSDRSVVQPLKSKSNPRFVFVHIGDEAKRESMKMADDLRHARIPLTQAIGIESLTAQMRYVETIDPPYLLIMGRKEALERSVILRERATHTETFIPLDSLVDTLRAVA